MIEHWETAAIILTMIGSILSSTLWLNGKFNEVEICLTKIETVLIIQKIMPSEFAKTNIESPKS